MEGTEDNDIAAAMGFSSFGGTKKRKFEHAKPSSPTAASSSGANSTRLGVRPKIEKDSGEAIQVQEIGSARDEADIVESTEPVPSLADNAKGKSKAQPAATSLADFLHRGHGLPEKPSNSPQDPPGSIAGGDAESSMVSFGGEPISRAELNALRQGVRNADGDLAYFLPSFVEDPWEKLEKSRR